MKKGMRARNERVNDQAGKKDTSTQLAIVGS